MPETPIALTRKAAGVLEERGIEDARLDAELLLASVLGVDRLELYLQHDRPLTEDEVAAYRAVIRRRLRHEPVQYIVAEAHFRELVLKVDRRVLIPRPETEVLVGTVLEWAGGAAANGSADRATGPAGEPERTDDDEAVGADGTAAAPERALTALDLGTGSGAIALSLLYEGPFERVVATDVSEEALELAAENADRVGVADRVEFRAGSLWEPVGADERFDVIVSNPPYISEAERPELPPEVREWEPPAALFAPAPGLDLVLRIVDGAASHLQRNGLLALEVGAGQAGQTARAVDDTGAFEATEIVRDYAGRERIVRAVRTADANG